MLQQRSGAATSALFYVDTQEHMHDTYRKVFKEVEERVHARGGRIRGRATSGRGRGFRVFVHRVLKDMHLLKRKQAHACPICTRLKLDRKRKVYLQGRLQMATTDADIQALKAAIDQVSKHIAYGEFHVHRRDHQRKATQAARDGLPAKKTGALCFVDYVSYYLCSGMKQNGPSCCLKFSCPPVLLPLPVRHKPTCPKPTALHSAGV